MTLSPAIKKPVFCLHQLIKRIVGLKPLSVDMGEARKSWRSTVHKNRNALHASIGLAQRSERYDKDMKLRIDDIVDKQHDAEFKLHEVESSFVSRLRGW